MAIIVVAISILLGVRLVDHAAGACTLELGLQYGSCLAKVAAQLRLSEHVSTATSLRLHGGGDVAEGASADAVNCRNADTLARLHPFPNDANLLFEEASHTYTVFGAVPERSCTSLIAAFFASSSFDPKAITEKYLERWRDDPSSTYYLQIQSVLEGGGSEADAAARIHDEWAERGAEASELGTAMHRFCEYELNGTPVAPPPEPEAETEQDNDELGGIEGETKTAIAADPGG